MGNFYNNPKLDRTMRLRYSVAFLATIAWPSVLALTPPSKNQNTPSELMRGVPTSSSSCPEVFLDINTRRKVLATFASASSALLVSSESAVAETTKPQEFVNVGTQAPPPDGDSPFVTLPNGVKTKDFRVGSDDSVGKDSRVSIQCSGRLLNLNGVVFYNTKNNNPDGFGAIPLTIDLGTGQAVPGLEAGLIGMRKGGIRRIIVPQELAYNKFPDLEPKPMNANDQRALDSVVNNPRRDAAILFDVQLERFK
jgi:FKBP-type peptidyl-prolyl cis-trans isomerase